MALRLKRKHIKALKRAVKEAAAWRGTLTGNPDFGPLEEFDKFIATAWEAWRILEAMHNPRELRYGEDGK